MYVFAAENGSLDDAARQLAERVATIANLRGRVRLEIRGNENVAMVRGVEWKGTLQRELEKAGVSVTEDVTAPLLKVGLAETPTRVVLTAKVEVAGREEIRIVTVERAGLRAASAPVAAVRLERQLVYESSERIVDASSLWNGAEGGMALLAFRRGELIVLQVDAAGTVKQSVLLSGANLRASRDPRGELNVAANEIQVTLPGKSCEFGWSSGGEAKCHVVKAAEAPGKSAGWRKATVLIPACDTNGWTLESEGKDWSEPDVLRVLPESAEQQGSAALQSDFPGPIVSINGEQDPSSALVVARNLVSGNYEVYKITLACGT